jgi:Predicted membrane protein (DUF2335)
LPAKPRQPESPTTEIPAEILGKLPPEVKDRLAKSGISIESKFSMSSTTYQGPWLPAPMLAEYEHYFPGWGERLLEGFASQVSHRQELEKLQFNRSENRMDRGQIFGFAVATMSILAAASIFIFAPSSFYTAIAALGIVVIGVGGPAVARVLATKFNWPNNKADSK